MQWLLTSYGGKTLSTFLLSMVPVIELRGGLPYGIAHDLSPWVAYVTAVLGNMVPIPFILLFLRKIFRWLKNYEKTKGLIQRLETRAHLKGRSLQKYQAFGLFLLVAIPLPGTGAWTGALVSSVLEIPLRKSLPIIFLGVCVAGILMLLISHSIKVIV